MKPPKAFVKRCLDIGVALPALIVTAPVQLAVAAAIRASMGSPVFFRQERPGLNGRPFTLIKFRSMRPLDPSQGLVDGSDDESPRMTPVGNFIRATSLDELPTLWNVLRGDMSLVGPRPLLMRYLDRYTPEQARRHEVKPGVTGLAQVSGRNTLSWESRFDFDLEYVEKCSLLLDLKILYRTVVIVFKRDGISEEGLPTMSEFRGTAAADEPVGAVSPERANQVDDSTRV